MTTPAPPLTLTVLARNEERRIGRCLASLPADRPDLAVRVVVNGSTDRTAAVARAAAGPGITVHEWAAGGKALSWNRVVHELLDAPAAAHLFADGDAQIAADSVDALAGALAGHPAVNAAAALPLNGRRAERYRREMLASHGLFGDLYALSGPFVHRLRAAAIRLPDDLVGDDGLIAALAKTDGQDESRWDEARVLPVPAAGFRCEPVSALRPRSLLVQHRRMVSYSVRHFQNRIVSAIMRSDGPTALPRRLASLYADWLPGFGPRSAPALRLYDRLALARMARQARAIEKTGQIG